MSGSQTERLTLFDFTEAVPLGDSDMMSMPLTDPSVGPEPFMEKAPRWQAIVDGVREHGETWAQEAPAHR